MIPIEIDILPIIVVIFSRDRATQLHATLRSYLLNCRDAERANLYVLYKTSNSVHARQYALLETEFAAYPNIHFLPEENFRRDLLSTLTGHSSLNRDRYRKFLRTLWLGRCFGFLSNRLLKFDRLDYVLFLVDDNLFVQPFYLSAAVNALEQQPLALGFSLRLGTNTTFCYPDGCSQQLPPFTRLQSGILRFDWTDGEHDFHYPLEVSSSIYRMPEILPFINRIQFRNPNTLESRMAARASEFRVSYPHLLCFERSVTFCNPVNRVTQNIQNRVAEEFSYTSQFLAEQFAAGYRIEVEHYRGFISNGCHQEVEYFFKKASSG
jgi:hypothetical protein